MRLEVCPGFLITLLVVPLVTVIVEHACVVHESVNRVDNIFVGNCPPSVVCKLLDFLDLLHQFLERSVCVPRLGQLREISDKVLVFYLLVLREEVCDDVLHPEMGESPIAIKYSGEKRFDNCLHDFLFTCTLQVYPFLELPCRLRMVAVEVSRGDNICPRWDDELA